MPNFREIDPSFWESYRSPFEYRYSSDAMRKIWSEENRWLLARDVEIAVAGVQRDAGIVTDEEYQDLVSHRNDMDVGTVLSREFNRNDPRFLGHDVAAFISEFADKAPIGGRILHQGMTSEDVLSNVEIMLMKESLEIVEDKLKNTLNSLAQRIEQHKDLVCLGYTHDQAAEPTTFGYRLARYAQDLLTDHQAIKFLNRELKGKGIKGAVGTSASFEHLLEGTDMSPREHEEKIMEKLGLESVIISGQTYPRKFTLMTISTLASIGQSCHQFAGDMKLLQASPFDEVAEPRGRNQVGSTAMPHKENPNSSEGIKALSRSLIGKVVEAWIDASEVTLERGLEDSAGKRSYLPESFLIVDEILQRTDRVVRGLVVRDTSIARNLKTFGPFMALELVLAQLSKKGADRQETHEFLRLKSQLAMDAVRRGEPNPLEQLTSSDGWVNQYLSREEISELFESVQDHIGDATERCEEMVQVIQEEIRK